MNYSIHIYTTQKINRINKIDQLLLNYTLIDINNRQTVDSHCQIKENINLNVLLCISFFVNLKSLKK